MSIKPFRFGLSVGGTTGRDDFVATVRKAEASGFDVISSADHISRRLAVLPMLATAAEISTLRISPMVIANDYRHPVLLAKETATIDV
ncbi:MAG: LLM class flavin-dependent oxidoreductase, partial [Acidimicrobiia bacterium]